MPAAKNLAELFKLLGSWVGCPPVVGMVALRYLAKGFRFFGGCPLWRSSCSPGDPAPQRQCAWLLSTYLRKMKSRRKCWKLKMMTRRKNEIDGEVGENDTQRAHEIWR